MQNRYILLLLLSIFLYSCSSPSSSKSFDTSKVIIESVVDKATGAEIKDARVVIDYEKEDLEDLSFDLKKLPLEIPVLVGERLVVEVSADGYTKSELGIRFSSAGKLFSMPVKLEKLREVEF